MNNKRNALGRGLSAILRNPKTDITDDSKNENNNVSNVSEILPPFLKSRKSAALFFKTKTQIVVST